MKRTMLTVLLVILAVLLCTACAEAETLKIAGTERADLRSSPNGSVIARFFGGVPADRLETKGKWSRVRIGQDPVSVTGWIRSEFLAPVESGEILYCGQDCIPARGHGTVALLEGRKKGSPILDTWDGTNGETIYTVAGVSGGNEWLMVARTGESGAAEWFFAAGDALADRKPGRLYRSVSPAMEKKQSVIRSNRFMAPSPSRISWICCRFSLFPEN